MLNKTRDGFVVVAVVVVLVVVVVVAVAVAVLSLPFAPLFGGQDLRCIGNTIQNLGFISLETILSTCFSDLRLLLFSFYTFGPWFFWDDAIVTGHTQPIGHLCVGEARI